MIIVCTQDPNVAGNLNGAAAWGAFNVLPAGPQAGANAAFAVALGALGAAEALALSAHGSNTELGDAQGGWDWDYDDIATLLVANAPAGYAGPILIHACATSVVNFSANLAQALRNQPALLNVWIYGYNRAVGAAESYPAPGGLSRDVSLQGTKV
jgi:hypothetical protein